MRWVFYAATASLVSAPSPSLAASNFDLNCVGVRETIDTQDGQPPLAELDVKKHLRVDLITNMWCEDACDLRLPLYAVTQDLLWLSEDGSNEITSVNRITGKFSRIVVGKTTGLHEDMQCTVAVFSGFPAAKF
jgi:hypothetical protein